MDFTAFRALLAIAVHGNITTAATELGLSQSAVSQSLRQLEERLGAVLIDRSRRPLKLTASGTIARRYVERMLEGADGLQAALRSQGMLPELRVALVDSFASAAGAAFVTAASRFTDNLFVSEGFSTLHATDFRERKLDMVVSAEPMETLEGVVRHRLMDEPFVLITPAGWTTGSGLPDLSALAESLPLIRYSGRSGAGPRIDLYLQQQGIIARRRIEVGSSQVMGGLVETGTGWGITTPLHLLHAREQLTRMQVHLLPEGPYRSLYLITRVGEYDSLVQALLLDLDRILGREVIPALRNLMPHVAQFVTVATHT